MTLAAALLAVVLMGCSESGLDNSVATAAVAPESEPFYALSQFSESVAVSEMRDGFTYTMIAYTGVKEGAGGNPQGYARVTVRKSYKKNGGVKYVEPLKVDRVHFAIACVRQCDAYGNCQVHEAKKHVEMNRDFWLHGNNGDWERFECDETPGGYNDLGVVTTYAAVVNMGKSDQVILMASTRKGNLTDVQVNGIHQNYILTAE